MKTFEEAYREFPKLANNDFMSYEKMRVVFDLAFNLVVAQHIDHHPPCREYEGIHPECLEFKSLMKTMANVAFSEGFKMGEQAKEKAESESALEH